MMINGYSAYIFDIDGTLLDTAPRILNCINLALEQSQIYLGSDKITRNLIGPKIADILNILGISASSELQEKVIKNFRNEYDANPVSDTVIYPQALKLISQVSTFSCPIFVATNKPFEPTMKLLKAFNFDFFNEIYCPNKYDGKVLSKRQMLQEIVSKGSFNPSNVLMIGDTKGDLEAANQVGCKFAFASWGYEKDKDIMENLSEIILR